MVRYLIDSNIFLEVILDQEKSNICSKFLQLHDKKELCISDFSLHSIGLMLLRRKKKDEYIYFIEEIFPFVEIVSLRAELFSTFALTWKQLLLDYDDFYQYWIAVEEGLTLVTLDSDFKKVSKDIPIIFL